MAERSTGAARICLFIPVCIACASAACNRRALAANTPSSSRSSRSERHLLIHHLVPTNYANLHLVCTDSELLIHLRATTRLQLRN